MWTPILPASLASLMALLGPGVLAGWGIPEGVGESTVLARAGPGCRRLSSSCRFCHVLSSPSLPQT